MNPRDADPLYVWDEADDMCPNCVTPWKCNGPHWLAFPRYAEPEPLPRRSLVMPLVLLAGAVGLGLVLWWVVVR